MQNFGILFIGFSVFYVLVFVLTHFKNEYYYDQKLARIFGVLLMLGLGTLQLHHFKFLSNHAYALSTLYLLVLYLIAPAFYFYARPVLKADDKFKLIYLLHFVPLILVFTLDHQQAFTLAFIIGSVYVLWLAKTIYALRIHKKQFKNELVLLTVAFLIAIAVSTVALTMPFTEQLFFSFYASSIGVALVIVGLVVSFRPAISQNISQAAQETYAVSTLSSIDSDAKLVLLESLMSDDKLYQQNNLDRQTIAFELDLTAHQLSELINTKLAMGFSQYLRLQRINAAKELLISQPKASVLSIGLDVGFSSQSNLYEAFKEIVGTTPAKFRKLNNGP